MLPPSIADALTEILGGTKILRVLPLSGGMIHQAARVETSTAPLFVKWHMAPKVEMFSTEAAGLRALRAIPGAPRIPDVLAVTEAFLALEYVAPVPIADSVGFTKCFAGSLAALHRNGIAGHPFGFETDGYIGELPQPNRTRTTDWSTFYRDQRLQPQITMAQKAHRLTENRERLLNTVCDRLPELLAEMPPDASLLHGDLWSGNFLCACGDEPVLIDPAAYYGPREMEIAFIELFGGFPPGFIAAYDEAFPLDPDYPRRRTVHQIYPLLVHLNHFGEQYGPPLESACLQALSNGGPVG